MIDVILPAYNEERVLRRLLLALDAELGSRGVAYRVLVVDDGSTDATVAEAERARTETDGRLPLTVLRHPENRGLGGALRTGIWWCLDNGGEDDIVVTLDADMTHPPSLIPTLVARIDAGADVVIASRYQPGSHVTGVPRSRLMLSELARIVLQLSFPIRGVKDYTCCFRAIRLSSLRLARAVYGEELTTARGFEAVMDLLLRLRQLDLRMTEVPFDLDYSDRVGRSKMRLMQTIRRTLALLSRRFVERFTTWSRRRVAKRLAEIEAAGATGRDRSGTTTAESVQA